MIQTDEGVFVKGKFYDFSEIDSMLYFGKSKSPILEDLCCPEFSRIWQHQNIDPKTYRSWITFHCGEPKEGNELVCLNPKSNRPAILLRPDWCPLRGKKDGTEGSR